jgi:two-component system, chemotaxis family, chemotaxis protein CheY
MKRILLVDDSRVTRELIKVYLIAKDVELQEAPDGAEALRMIRAKPPDLVLADLRMPRLDGFGLCQALQADPRLRNVPVLILTSNRDAGVEERLKGAGALQVLLKPIQPQPLQDAIQKHLLAAPPAP